jgi:hypothetical protein
MDLGNISSDRQHSIEWLDLNGFILVANKQ